MFANRRKVFCIGFNKTGTSSLHEFFKACHLKSAHNDQWPRYSHIDTGKSYFSKQCYSDGEQSDFAALDKWFPRSLFILNDRNEKDWLRSRIKHVLRFNEENMDLRTVLVSDRYGRMAKDFLADEESAVRKWITERRIYARQARVYFEGRSDFLEIDITSDSHWNATLLAFFERNHFPVPTAGVTEAVHQNRRNREDLTNQELLQTYFRMADGLLASCSGDDPQRSPASRAIGAALSLGRSK